MLTTRMRSQMGLSLVELMIGIAVGLFVTAAAALVVSNHLNDNRRLILETQVQQDMRAAAEVITRDLRRAGYWQAAEQGVWRTDALPRANPYAAIGVVDDADGAVTEYTYSLDEKRNVAENDAIDEADERSGFRLRNGRIQMQLGAGNWQDVTDSTTLNITRFDIALADESIDLGRFCAKACAGEANCPPVQKVRSFTVRIEGHATHDTSVTRGMHSTVRVRNDEVTGSCPA